MISWPYILRTLTAMAIVAVATVGLVVSATIVGVVFFVYELYAHSPFKRPQRRHA